MPIAWILLSESLDRCDKVVEMRCQEGSELVCVMICEKLQARFGENGEISASADPLVQYRRIK